MIAGGRGGVRKVLFMGTLTAIRRNPAIKDLYDRLAGAGRPKKRAHRLHAQAHHRPQRHHPGPHRMENRLTRKTVAHLEQSATGQLVYYLIPNSSRVTYIF